MDTELPDVMYLKLIGNLSWPVQAFLGNIIYRKGLGNLHGQVSDIEFHNRLAELVSP